MAGIQRIPRVVALFNLLAGALASVATAAGFTLRSPAFPASGKILRTYTCDGSDISPPLRWTAPPRGTRTFSLTMVDLDAWLPALARDSDPRAAPLASRGRARGT